MKFQTLISCVLATVFTILALATALQPANGPRSTAIRKRQFSNAWYRDYVLVCTSHSAVNAATCWDRYRTYCDSNGFMQNEATGLQNGRRLCMRDVCYCQRDWNMVLPGFYDIGSLKIENATTSPSPIVILSKPSNATNTTSPNQTQTPVSGGTRNKNSLFALIVLAIGFVFF